MDQPWFNPELVERKLKRRGIEMPAHFRSTEIIDEKTKNPIVPTTEGNDRHRHRSSYIEDGALGLL